MSVFLKRGKWWGRKESGESKRFNTEEEAYTFTGEVKPVPKRRKPKKTFTTTPKKVVKPISTSIKNPTSN